MLKCSMIALGEIKRVRMQIGKKKKESYYIYEPFLYLLNLLASLITLRNTVLEMLLDNTLLTVILVK